MTVSQLLRSLTSYELSEWIAWLKAQDQEREKQLKELRR